MKSIFNRPPNSRALATALGQSSTEYLVICAALALALGLEWKEEGAFA